MTNIHEKVTIDKQERGELTSVLQTAEQAGGDGTFVLAGYLLVRLARLLEPIAVKIYERTDRSRETPQTKF